MGDQPPAAGVPARSSRGRASSALCRSHDPRRRGTHHRWQREPSLRRLLPPSESCRSSRIASAAAVSRCPAHEAYLRRRRRTEPPPPARAVSISVRRRRRSRGRSRLRYLPTPAPEARCPTTGRRVQDNLTRDSWLFFLVPGDEQLRCGPRFWASWTHGPHYQENREARAVSTPCSSGGSPYRDRSTLPTASRHSSSRTATG